jgi:membrane protease YdiL (CAAX protease family)
MDNSGSDSSRGALPAFVGLVAVLLGWGAMQAVAFVGIRQGWFASAFRPMLLASELALVAPGLLFLALFGSSAPLALRRLDRRATLLGLLLAGSLWGMSLGVFEVQYALWPPPPGYVDAFRRVHAALRPSNPLDALLSITAIAVAPALCEELLFRGVALSSFVRGLGSSGAVVASSLLFGLIHVDFAPQPTFYRVPFACAVGLALGAIRLAAGSLSPAMLAHATLNTITFVVTPLVDDPSQPAPDPRPVVGALLLAGGVALTTVLLRRFRAR